MLLSIRIWRVRLLLLIFGLHGTVYVITQIDFVVLHRCIKLLANLLILLFKTLVDLFLSITDFTFINNDYVLLRYIFWTNLTVEIVIIIGTIGAPQPLCTGSLVHSTVTLLSFLEC